VSKSPEITVVIRGNIDIEVAMPASTWHNISASLAGDEAPTTMTMLRVSEITEALRFVMV
jgi:hypothetical protein